MRGFLLVLLLLGSPQPARAAVFEPMSLDDLLASSQRVVLGEVLSSDAVLDQERGRITTRHRVRVQETLKGEEATEVVVITMGGETKDLGQIVPGAARLEAGTELLLCLRKGRAGFVVTGMAQGVFRVQGDPGGRVFTRDLRGIHFTGHPSDGAPDHLDEGALRSRLKGGAAR